MGFSEVTTRLLASEMLVRASTGGGHLEGGAGQCRVSESNVDAQLDVEKEKPSVAVH